MPEVVQFPAKNISDIPEMLRHTADRIERGELGEVTSLFVVIPVTDDFPKLFGFGDIDGHNDPMTQLELCKHWLLTNLVSRGY